MSKSIGSTEQADRFRIEGLPDLSGLATEFLRRQPREAQVAVTIALETAAALRRSWADRTHVETLERMEHHLIHVAVDIALATAAAQREALAEGVPEEVPERLQPFFVRRARADDLVGVSEAAAQLEVSRTTVYDWAARKKLLAWRSTKRGLTIPVEQILGPGKVVPGVPKVLEVIDDPELAWAFLTQDWPFADDMARPLDKLVRGEVEDVLRAAPGFGMSFT